jgi:hypothetical protein
LEIVTQISAIRAVKNNHSKKKFHSDIFAKNRFKSPKIVIIDPLWLCSGDRIAIGGPVFSACSKNRSDRRKFRSKLEAARRLLGSISRNFISAENFSDKFLTNIQFLPKTGLKFI